MANIASLRTKWAHDKKEKRLPHVRVFSEMRRPFFLFNRFRKCWQGVINNLCITKILQTVGDFQLFDTSRARIDGILDTPNQPQKKHSTSYFCSAWRMASNVHEFACRSDNSESFIKLPQVC